MARELSGFIGSDIESHVLSDQQEGYLYREGMPDMADEA